MNKQALIKHILSQSHLVFLVLFGLGLLTYINSLNNPFMIDDHAFFSSRGIDTDNVSYVRPLAHLIPAFFFGLFGKWVIGYHLGNLLLFVVAAFVLYQLIRYFFDEPVMAFSAAALYLIHPINGIIVNYITASVFAVQVILMLGSLYFLVRDREAVGHGDFKGKICSIVFFMLALMCHETAMALPFYAFVLVAIKNNKDIKGVVLRTWPLWVVLVLYFCFRLNYHSINNSIFYNISRLQVNGVEYIASLMHLIGWYLGKFIYPEGITMMWTVKAVRHGAEILAFSGVLLLMVLGRVLWCWNLPKPVILGLGWLLAGFIPLCFGAVVSPLQGFLIEPHWFVFSSTGFFILIAWVLSCMWKNARIGASILMGVLMLVWITTSWMYNDVWGNEERYCRQWLFYCPEFKAVSYFLANAYMKEGDYEKARYYFNQSLLNRKKDWLVYFNLGLLDIKQERLDSAEDNFKKVLTLEPKSKEAKMALRFINRQKQKIRF